MDGSDIMGQNCFIEFMDPAMYTQQSTYIDPSDGYIDPFFLENSIDVCLESQQSRAELDCITARPLRTRKRRRQSTPDSGRQHVSPQYQDLPDSADPAQDLPDSTDPVAERRARNTQAARESRARRVQKMNELEASLAAERAKTKEFEAKTKELEAKIARLEELRNAEGARRPSSIIAITADIDDGLSDDDNDPTNGPINLVEDDFECVKARASLNDRTINTVLHLLSALAPYSIWTVDSTADKTEITCGWLGDSGQGAPHPKILIPIHIPRTTSIGHWALVVLDANDARLLDPCPTEFHMQFAREKVQWLFSDQPSFQPTWTFVEEAGRAGLDPESVDCGVLVLVNAIYITAASLGSTIGPPCTPNVELWRDVLGLVLRMAMGQTSRLPWTERLGRNGTLLGSEGVELSKGREQLLQRLGSDFVTYQDAHDAITHIQQLLSQQEARLAKVAAEIREKRAMAAREGDGIRMILESLCTGAVSQEWQVKKLDAEKKHCEDGLSALAWLKQPSAESLFSNRGREFSIARLDVRRRLRKIDTCLARRVAMLASLGETVRALGEAVKSLEESWD